jgi:SAM-dependent methyltransferase
VESIAPVLPTDPYTAFKQLSDDQWRAVLLQTVHQRAVDGVELPGFPDEDTQVGFTSHKNEAALVEALAFFDIVKRAGSQYGLGWAADTRLVDFGSGWGRITRTFLKDIAPHNLFGIEINPEVLATCRRLMPYGEFQPCDIGEPLAHADNSVDVVTAFSVFSHLSEENHRHWIDEFHRILRPGGVAVFTTLSREFLHRCHGALESAPGDDLFARQVRALVERGAIKGLTGSFHEFPRDEFFYLPTGGGIAGTEEANYGWAIIPLAYAQRHWADRFEICEFADPMSPLDQAVFALRKRGGPATHIPFVAQLPADEPTPSSARRAVTKVAGFVRRQRGGTRVVEASKAALRELRRPGTDAPPVARTRGAALLPHSNVMSDAMPSFDDLAEDYPEDRIPPIDRSDVDESKLTWDQLQWRRYGYLVIPGFMPDELIDAYVEHRERVGVGLGGFETTVWQDTADEIKAIGCYKPLADKIAELMSEELALNFTLTQFTSTQRQWHQDDYLGPPDLFGRYCAVWIALGDVHPDSGPFQFVPGSQRWKGMRGHLIRERLQPEVREWQGREGEGGHWAAIAESFTTPAYQAEIDRTGLPIETFRPRRGDILIWHGKLVHRGSMAVVPGMRRPSIICHYYPATMKPLPTERFRGGGLYWPEKDA